MLETFLRNHIAKGLNVKESQVNNTIDLIAGGATIPFISRYRKEKTGGLDETQITEIFERYIYFTDLEKRKVTILKTIADQGKLTPEFEKKIKLCLDKTELEDIYLPYKPKKRTRATIAKEKGLEPLADIIFNQKNVSGSKESIVSKYIDPEKGVASCEEAISGALDIVAERISDIPEIRGWARNTMSKQGIVQSKAKKDWIKKKSKFQDYYEYSEPLSKSASHRMLAIRRGEKEGVLSWKIDVDEDVMIRYIGSKVVTSKSFLFVDELKTAISDSYKRLMFPSIEKEVFKQKIEECESDSISVFSKNLKNLLLAPPAGNKIIMGLDPGFRTGCKLVIIDENGSYKEFKAIFPHEPQKKSVEAEKVVFDLIGKYSVQLIAIGNGTASKESDIFIRNIIKKHQVSVSSMVVSEAGASVYSASETAKKEFPELDVTVRGAISIARRLQDPLAELVKIDPKSIGVGQYQHDVNQKELKQSLDLAVESCVNYVGVELNTASVDILSYISGIGSGLAENIVKYRTENGSFFSRSELKKVPKLGEKAFEQCAGFLRIRNSKNPLDNSAIHPETYTIVKKMAGDSGVSLTELIGNAALIDTIKLKEYVTSDFGLPTLTDITNELRKPGLDPRKEFTSIEFSDAINEIEDLKPEMVLRGSVTNVTNFGAFVDIGVHQDGLVHVSKLSQSFVKDPHAIVSVGDSITVKVVAVDVELKRISLERVE